MKQATIKFNPPNPMYHNPDVIAATFYLDNGIPGRDAIAFIYTDGKCSCGDAKFGGLCRHMIAWRQQLGRDKEPPSKRLVAIGDETGVTAVAADFDEQLEAERWELADYDATVNDAAGRRGY
jgi:hypothetical protein